MPQNISSSGGHHVLQVVCTQYINVILYLTVTHFTKAVTVTETTQSASGTKVDLRLGRYSQALPLLVSILLVPLAPLDSG